MLHPAHVLPPGFVTVGGGVAGQLSLRPRPGGVDPQGPGSLQDLAVAPGVSPWVSGRVGIREDNEAGISYSGRSFRIDGRHAFDLGGPALSVGLGASAVIARRPGQVNDGSSVYGGGLDLPVLLGFRSRSDLYAIWFGPRASVELLSGTLNLNADPTMAGDFIDVKARHFAVGGLLGLQAGFRHVHVAIELDASYHRADGTFGTASVSLNQVTLTPGGALLLTF